MKSGIVLIPFQDGLTGTAFKVNDKFKGDSKRFEELLKVGLISETKEGSDKESKKSNKKSVEKDNKEESETKEGSDEESTTDSE